MLRLTGLKCAISPLHDKDKHSDPKHADYGKLKKPHWHAVVSWDGPQTQNAANNITKERLKGTIAIKLDSVRGYYRYLTHMDDPDKYQYDKKDIQHLNGFDIADHIEMTANEKFKILATIQNFVDDNDIREYGRLCKLLLQADETDMWRVAASNTLYCNTYITSRRHELEAIAEKQRQEAEGSGN
jgi:hypothetical protein